MTELINPVRYINHIELKNFGEEGQIKVQNSSVALVGLGGLGCPASLYLTAAGIGHLKLIDADIVNVSNLGRQILYTPLDMGISKVECAQRFLTVLNTKISVSIEKKFVTEENINELLYNCEVILDCSDNFDTRYLLNKYAIKNNKILISGAVSGFQGQVFTFKQGFPCYYCLFPVKPNSHQAPTCTEAAVLGTLVGTIGVMMATETLKEIVNLGQSLAGSFLSVNTENSEVHKMNFAKDSHCPICGTLTSN